MKDPVNSAINLPIELPELSLQVVSFLQIAFYLAIATLVYYLTRKLVQLVSSTGALEKRTLYYQIIQGSTFTLPAFIFLYGLTSVSEDSLFVSLLFFVIFSIVFGLSLVAPAKSLFASLLIAVRGDIRVGDYISFEKIEGEILAIGAFNIILHGKNGGKSYIPTQKILQNSYEIHAKKGGPSIVLTIPGDKVSKKNLERLANLCPFKRNGSDIRITTLDKNHKLTIEIVSRECRPWVTKYFEQHYQ